MVNPSQLPNVSVIVPCWNEERYIAKCLDSIIQGDYPKDKLEVLVVDGMSEDRTRDIIRQYSLQHQFVQLLDNPRRIIPAGMNLAISKARGLIIMKMDAHARYENDYIYRCVRSLHGYHADNVGGRFLVLPGNDGIMAKAIAMVMTHPFGSGRYYQWMSRCQGPTEVDTVSFGCFRKNLLDRLGLVFNENLMRGEDVDFNARLKKAGGRVLLVPDIVFYYYARPHLKAFVRHQFSSGFWGMYGAKFGLPITLRGVLSTLFPSILLFLPLLSFLGNVFLLLFVLAICLYGILNLSLSFGVAIQERKMKYLLVMPLAFVAFHVSHGLGSLCGLVKRLR